MRPERTWVIYYPGGKADHDEVEQEVKENEGTRKVMSVAGISSTTVSGRHCGAAPSITRSVLLCSDREYTESKFIWLSRA